MAGLPRQPAQQDPAGPSVKRIRQRHEFAAPAIDRAEIVRERIHHGFGYDAPVSAEARKVHLVQRQRIQRRRLILLQAADDMRRCRGRIECFELFGNRVQAREGAAIVVLIVALDEPWRDAQKSRRPAEQGCDLILHVDVSRIRRGRLDVIVPNAAALRRGHVASARCGRDLGNDMRQAIARKRAMCSAWADAFGIWATAIEPYSSKNHLP